MRFKLTLSIDKHVFGNRISFNYMYECSALIYKILSKSDVAFSSWLHGNGFSLDSGKQFRLFTFSRLQIPKYRIDGQFISIQSETIEWLISFLPERSTREFIKGLFCEQIFDLGNRQANIRCRVKNVEMLPSPDFTESMQFQTLSPICITLNKDDKQEYISPNHSEAERLVRGNLLDKYQALHGAEFPEKDFPFTLKALSSPKPSLITIKAGTPQESRIRGFLFKFQMQAPVELIKIAYEAGIGGKNSMGFGMIKPL